MLGLSMLVLWNAHAATEEARWQATLDRVTRAVVTIRMDRPIAFEGNGAANSTATGFVVDAERGLILTNRHVVTPAPVIAKAIFLDQEEVALTPIYRDPVHDFGLFRYDPDALRYMDAPSLPLRPDRVRVGVPIRVVGNDAGELVSILDSTIARLDRPAPNYGSDFNDFNTFYIQAASATSGGSSGSPVVDIRGHVLALNAGGNGGSASSFYLPLDRVKRAVELIQRGEPVPRGTLQARLHYTPYDEVKKLGLSDAAEVAARRANPAGIGMLVVRDIVPGGPLHDKAQIGDVLLEVAGTPVYDFVTLEAMLDDHVRDTLPLVVERAGKRLEIDATVSDLHALVPSRYLRFGDGVLHDLSYHQARVMQVPIEGVYVADNGYAMERDGLPWKSILTEADGRTLTDLDDLVATLATVPDGAPIQFRWYRQGAPQQEFVTSVRMDRHWFEAEICTRDDTTGTWPCTTLADPGGTWTPEVPAAPLPPVDDKRAKRLVTSLVTVECDIPYQVAGVPGNNYIGGGLIVDAEKGWVLVDRDTVPSAVAALTVTVAGTLRVPARLVALHPRHNFAIVAYDPEALAHLGLTTAVLSDAPVEVGDEAWSITLEADSSLDVREVEVRDIDPIQLGVDGAPRFRESNLDVLRLDPPPSRNGVLVDKKGRVLGYHASFSYTSGRDNSAFLRTVSSEIVRETVQFAQSGELRGLGWELGLMDLPTALESGLPPDWVETLLAHDPTRRSVLVVRRVQLGSGLEDLVSPGDMVLAVQGRPTTAYRDLERAAQHQSAVPVTLVHAGEVREVSLPTERYSFVDVDRVLLWQGLRIHAPHRSSRSAGVLPNFPYVAWRNNGSPGGRAKLFAQRSILSINDVPTPDMDALVAVIGALPEGKPVKITAQNRRLEREVYTLDPDRVFWPTEELRWSAEGGWVRSPL